MEEHYQRLRDTIDLTRRKRICDCDHKLCGCPRRFNAERLTAPQTADERPEPKTEETREFLPVAPPGIPRVNCQLHNIDHQLYCPSYIPSWHDAVPTPYQQKYVYPPYGPHVHPPFASKFWKSKYHEDFIWRKEEDPKPVVSLDQVHRLMETLKMEQGECGEEDWRVADKAFKERLGHGHVTVSSRKDELDRKFLARILDFPFWTNGKPYKPPYIHPYFDDPYYLVEDVQPQKYKFLHLDRWRKGFLEFDQPRKWEQPQQAQGSDQPQQAQDGNLPDYRRPKPPPKSYGLKAHEMPDSPGTFYNFDLPADRRDPYARVGMKGELAYPGEPEHHKSSFGRTKYRDDYPEPEGFEGPFPKRESEKFGGYDYPAGIEYYYGLSFGNVDLSLPPRYGRSGDIVE